MSLSSRLYRQVVLALVVLSTGHAQLFSDQGLFSGSGLTIMPTATISPTSEFSLQYGRLNFLKRDFSGINVISVNSGFSSLLEGYIRVTSEQLGTVNSQVAYGFGGKFRLPVEVPVLRRLAIWMESTLADEKQQNALFPSRAFRTATVATFDSNGIHPTLLAGMSNINDQINPLFGAGVTIAVGHNFQIGLEMMHGYLEQKSTQALARMGVRILPSLTLQASPGYLSAAGVSTMTVSFGISLSTSDVDFEPAQEEKKSDEFTMPSIDEIEKQLNENPAGNDTLHESLPNQHSSSADSTNHSFNEGSQPAQSVGEKPGSNKDFSAYAEGRRIDRDEATNKEMKNE